VLDENGRCGDVPVGTFLDKYRYLISPWVFNVVSGVLRDEMQVSYTHAVTYLC
jgi:hypothetical protein